jgi:hypothetical protein
MCNNDFLKKLKWRVPLTCDIECGPNWMVQWHVTKMMYGKKAWPDELKPYFPKTIARLAEGVNSAVPPTVQPANPAEASKTTLASGAANDAEPKPVGGVYTHTVTGPLTTVRAFRLAETIAKCVGKGTSRLRLVSPDGTEIDYGPTVLVNHAEFNLRVRDAGL